MKPLSSIHIPHLSFEITLLFIALFHPFSSSFYFASTHRPSLVILAFRGVFTVILSLCIVILSGSICCYTFLILRASGRERERERETKRDRQIQIIQFDPKDIGSMSRFVLHFPDQIFILTRLTFTSYQCIVIRDSATCISTESVENLLGLGV